MSVSPYPLESLGDFDTSIELDARLGALALRARTDPNARDALYRLLEFKIERFVRHYRFRAGQMTVYEFDDVAQEAYVVFCDLIERWPGDRSFLGYFFTRFPWWLSKAISRIERGTSTNQFVPIEEVDEPPPSPYPDDELVLVEAGALLGPRDRALLELRVGYGMDMRQIARTLGVHSRTLHRHWARIIDDLREGWESEPCGRAQERVTLTGPGDDGVINGVSLNMVEHQELGEN
jgi:RNA polymerase sigma factor (sigma-70 family)